MKKIILISSIVFTSLKVNSQVITTIAGSGTTLGDGGLATSALLMSPRGVAIDGAGNIYIAEWNNHKIRKVTASTGIITTIAGTGTAGYNGDNIPATSAELNKPFSVALDAAGNIYIADGYNNRVRKVIVSTGIITTIAGDSIAGYNGDNIAATTAELNRPTSVALDASGNIYIADYNNNRIRELNITTGIITTIAGNGTAGYNGDNIVAITAELNPSFWAFKIASDAIGNIYIDDGGNHRIRKVTASSGIITTIAGIGTSGYNGDSIPATTAEITSPYGITIDAAGNLFIADGTRIRKVDAITNLISTLVNLGSFDLALDGGGKIYGADNQGLIRKVDMSVNKYYNSLDINNVRTPFSPDGYMFWDFISAQFEVPKDSNKHTIFAGAPWIGGIDNGGLLHVAAGTYRQTGSDFFPGPIRDSASNSFGIYNQWNTIWKINKTTIDSFKLWYANHSFDTNYVIPPVILNWPANAAYAYGEGPCLAPYYDYNGDGVYNPADGDYPLIKGDQALFFVYNDNDSAHTETGSPKMKVQFNVMAYAFNNPNDSILDNTIFLNYQILNYSENTYDSTYIGSWTDFDIGDYLDDYVGCDVSRSAYFGYNADSVDPGPTGYGANPPAQSIVFLKGPPINPQDTFYNTQDNIIGNPQGTLPMTNFMYFNNDFSVTGNPQNGAQNYNYLRNIWKDNHHTIYGGTGYDSTGNGINCNYMYPGSSDPLGWGTNNNPQPPWDEYTANDIIGDRRGLGSSGPFTFHPGDVVCVDYAYIFSRADSGGNLASVAKMRSDIDHIRSFYMNDTTLQRCSCSSFNIGIPQHNEQPPTVKVYPNPFNSSTNIVINSLLLKEGKKLSLSVYDLLGNEVNRIDNISTSLIILDRGQLSQGMYFYKLTSGSETLATGKLIVE